jgi:NTP pyrophosphatase (non-canonical NTP hydrolase)
MTKAIDLMHLGKLAEELSECSSAVARCIIQGISEAEPSTGKINLAWLEDEIADVVANIDLVIEHFGLNNESIVARAEFKQKYLKRWHKTLEPKA